MSYEKRRIDSLIRAHGMVSAARYGIAAAVVSFTADEDTDIEQQLSDIDKRLGQLLSTMAKRGGI